MDENQAKIENKLLKLEGDIYTFLLKTQEYDKKIEKVDAFNELMFKLNGRINCFEDNVIDLTKNNKNRHNENLEKLADIYQIIESVVKKTESLEQKFKDTIYLKNSVDDLQSKNQDNLSQIQSISSAINRINENGLLLTSKIKDGFEQFKEDLNKCVKTSDHLADIQSVKSMQRSFSDSLEISLSTLKDDIKKLYLSQDTLSVQCEEFKKNAASKLNAVLEAFQVSVKKQIEESKPKDIMPLVLAVEKNQDNLRLDVDNNTLRKDILDREIDIINRKLEKVFLLLKKLELSKEG